MTQSSIAVSKDGDAWVVLNASPDIRAQLAATPPLRPGSLRGSPIKAVVLTNGDVDHVAGLLTLREKTAFDVFGTTEILSALAENPIFAVMDEELVKRRPIAPGERIETAGLTIEAFAVPGKVPLYREAGEVKTEEISEVTIGLSISDGRRTLAYIPGCAAIPDDLSARLSASDMVLFDGTVWENEEMPRLGAGVKTGKRMGHLPISGPGGSLEALAGLKARKSYIHINNTNPILQPASKERALVEAAGWTITADGEEILL